MTRYVAIDHRIGDSNGNGFARRGFSADEHESGHGPRHRVKPARDGIDPQQIECTPI